MIVSAGQKCLSDLDDGGAEKVKKTKIKAKLKSHRDQHADATW